MNLSPSRSSTPPCRKQPPRLGKQRRPIAPSHVGGRYGLQAWLNIVSFLKTLLRISIVLSVLLQTKISKLPDSFWEERRKVDGPLFPCMHNSFTHPTAKQLDAMRVVVGLVTRCFGFCCFCQLRNRNRSLRNKANKRRRNEQQRYAASISFCVGGNYRTGMQIHYLTCEIVVQAGGGVYACCLDSRGG